MAQTVKNPPAMQETQIRSLGWEDPLEEGMITHCSILAWRIPRDRGAWQAVVHVVAKSQTQVRESAQHSTLTIMTADGSVSKNAGFCVPYVEEVRSPTVSSRMAPPESGSQGC